MTIALLDTNIVVSLLNSNDAMHESALKTVRVWEDRSAVFPLSVIVWSELLTGAFRQPESTFAFSRLKAMRDGYFSDVVPVCEEVADHAARLRAVDAALRLPDALVIASGIHVGADAVLTADKKLKKVAPGLVELVTV
ncbi:type II toxin-antitoxin system VapC family toxin [Actinorugispora endophytica]|uniref:PIN domain-containing protein n=1 Tax=Actinorugispora endophytica TaxID=1605990 RepID=A0A4V3D8S3_9ACTN|nr:PIN domain-containing protein [Actinorugispora endophytica]TDQ52931.1 hypothetical protein EV190_10548 [Actinorugispora endophytica]